jgi:hypothetical protein
MTQKKEKGRPKIIGVARFPISNRGKSKRKKGINVVIPKIV